MSRSCGLSCLFLNKQEKLGFCKTIFLALPVPLFQNASYSLHPSQTVDFTSKTHSNQQNALINMSLLINIFFNSSDGAQDLLGGWLLYREQFPCMNLECVFVCDLLDVCKNTDKSVWRFK